MWKATIAIQKILQIFNPQLTILYNSHTHTFKANSNISRKSLGYYSVIVNEIFTVVTSLVNIIVYIKSSAGDLALALDSNPFQSAESKKVFTEQFFNVIIDVYTFTLALFALICTHTLFRFKHSIAWVINQLVKAGKRDRPFQKHSSKENLMLYVTLFNTILTVISLSANPWVFKKIGSRQAMKLLLPKSYSNNEILVSALASLRSLLTAFFGATSVLQILILLCLALNESQFLLRPAYTTGFSNRLTFHEAMIIFRASSLISATCNEILAICAPIFLLTGFVINVSTSFAFIKLHNLMPVAVTLVLVTVDVGVGTATVIVHHFSCVVYDEYKKFEKYWKPKLIYMRYKRMFWSTAPIVCRIGMFGCMKPTTFLNSLDAIVNYTVILLLATRSRNLTLINHDVAVVLPLILLIHQHLGCSIASNPLDGIYPNLTECFVRLPRDGEADTLERNQILKENCKNGNLALAKYQLGSVGDYYFVEPDTIVSSVIKLLRISDSVDVEDEKLEPGWMRMKYCPNAKPLHWA
ncbi:unnamed protein product [Orchesella dallaii]|uniref:Uncharacterized protein n=1 Tax=Orchesella dallaii TaxID=48710 RepID=A0ABP1S280_9HEXA